MNFPLITNHLSDKEKQKYLNMLIWQYTARIHITTARIEALKNPTIEKILNILKENKLKMFYINEVTSDDPFLLKVYECLILSSHNAITKNDIINLIKK